MRIVLLAWIKRHKFRLGTAILVCTGYLFLIRVPLFHDPMSTVIFDRHGELLGARVASDGQWRFQGSRSIPEKIRRTTLAFEDRYFYFHPGFNPVSLARSAWLNLKSGKIISGGSTITMQTIRLSRKGKRRTIQEKVIELVLATRLELSRSKNEILNLYLSNAPYGGNVVGINAAAWRYFGTASQDLSWAEAATLAVLPNSPALIHPGKNRNLLLAKRNYLLRKLHKAGWIDRTTMELSYSEAIPEKPVAMPKRASHLLDRLGRGPQAEYRTTLDGRLQDRASDILAKHHKLLKYNGIHNEAAIIAEVETGNILVYLGNAGNDENGSEVDIIRSSRSTGSILKPFLYAAMLDDGKILPNSLVTDIPINMSGFAPRNFNGEYEGAIQASLALSRSLNVPAVVELREYGIERFRNLLRNLGMTTLVRPADHYGLSLILGGAEGSLEDITAMYSGLSRVLIHYAATGMYYPSDIRPLNLVYGKVSPAAPGREESGMISASAIWFTYKAMDELGRPAEETGWKYFGTSRKIAWKTGTSFGFRDGWAIGTSPAYVAGVWVGNADGEGRPGLTGISAAAPVLFELFGILPESEWFGEPADELVQAVICRESGLLAGPLCVNRDTLSIPESGIRSQVCLYHRTIHLTPDFQYRVNSNCLETSLMVHSSWFVLPPVQEWYYRNRHSDYRLMPPYREGCEPVAEGSMDLIYPAEKTRIFVPIELSGKKGRAIFEAVHRDQNAMIFWHLDGKFISCTKNIHQVELYPDTGKHKLILVDDKGEELVRYFTVMGREVRKGS